MVDRLGIDAKKAPDMNHFLYNNYGTSMAGLRAIGYDLDNDDYHSFVHGRLPYHKLNPDHQLRTLLLSLPLRKVIFSNADKVHVAKVLSKLGLVGCFDEIICFETLNPSSTNTTPGNDMRHTCCHTNVSASAFAFPLPPTSTLCKPQEAAFQVALNKANIDPNKTLFFDDSIRNIQAAKRVGLHTVLVGTSVQSEGVDFALESIHNMKEALPQLWLLNDFDRSLNTRICRKTAIQTSVEA
ncbi:ripening-related-like protein [Senna tora]|uniref:Ripening-related-like protein n=1 Tax=Senna tora TaxID=362788 RepID=A0A834T864_9FABA|nr:ripening-related-like protein [Senna tora]